MPDLRGRRVLVTGAAGFVGANLTRELLRQGAEVHVVLRGSTDSWRIADAWPRLSVHRADLLDSAAVQAALAAARPQVLFHLAMPSGHPKSRSERESTLRACLLGTSHVLESAAALGVGRFVHLGSFLEYGPRRRPARETDPLDPVTARGAAKAAATLWCRQFARASGLRVVVLRAFSVYGPWEHEGRLVPTAVRAALDGSPMGLTKVASRHDFIFVGDLIEACLRAVDADLPPGDVINVGTGRLSSNREVVAAVEAVCGLRIQIAGEHPAQPADLSSCAADLAKARIALGWRPLHSLRQGIEATVAFRSACPASPVAAGGAPGEP